MSLVNALFNAVVSASDANLSLVPIRYKSGLPTKAPTAKGWNLPRSTENPHGYTSSFNVLRRALQDSGGKINFGLHHGANRTVALDLDDFELSKQVFGELDIPIQDWLADDGRLEIKSPKANRGKLIFRLPKQFKPDGVKQFKYDGNVIFELRCGHGSQDVLIGTHPEGGQYQIIGDLAAIPSAPDVLVDMLQNWDAWKPCLDSALGIEPEIKIVESATPQAGNLSGLVGNLGAQQRDPIKEFNQSWSVERVLLENGYSKAGKDRFIRPNSTSKAPAVAIMRSCSDGIERVYSHGGDSLNDGCAHDPFDVYRLLNCGGDLKLALNWNPEITKHNQQLYMKSQSATVAPVATVATVPAGDAMFPLISARDLTSTPLQTDWLLKGFLERQTLNLLFGESGAGKSLFALDWAFCIAHGMDWHGHRTKAGDVVIVAGEGFHGMARRLKALEAKYSVLAPERLFISQKPAQLDDANNASWVAASVRQLSPNPALIIIDTLHRNFNGDENSSQDIGRFINSLDEHLKPLGAAILVVHHSGHGDKTRSRGSSSIKAAMDGEFAVTKEGMTSIIACTKSKDFQAGQAKRFGITQTELDWLDDEGMPQTSVYLEFVDDGSAGAKQKQKRLSPKDELLLTSLSLAIREVGIEATPEIKKQFSGAWLNNQQAVVSLDDWRPYAYKATVCDSTEQGAIRLAFNRSKNNLLRMGKIAHHDGFYWAILD